MMSTTPPTQQPPLQAQCLSKCPHRQTISSCCCSACTTILSMNLNTAIQVDKDYKSDVIQHLYNLEQNTKCNPQMMQIQPELQDYMRQHLVEFLVEAHLFFKLNKETLFLAINIVDRYSSKVVVHKRHYQLVGCASLWIASKYYDRKSRVPTLDELQQLCEKSYTNHMILQMESHILNTLDWDLSHPTPDTFIDYYIGLVLVDIDDVYIQIVRNLSLYLCERMLFDCKFLQFSTSLTCLSAYKVSLLITSNGREMPVPWSQDEQNCLQLLAQEMTCNTSASLVRKYSVKEYSEAHLRLSWFLENGGCLSQPTDQSDQPIEKQAERLYDSCVPPSPQSPDSSGANQYHQLRQHRPAPTMLALSPESSPYRLQVNGIMTPPFTPDEETNGHHDHGNIQQQIFQHTHHSHIQSKTDKPIFSMQQINMEF